MFSEVVKIFEGAQEIGVENRVVYKMSIFSEYCRVIYFKINIDKI